MSDESRSESAESEDEIARRRDEGLRRLLKVKPKPHKEIAGKGKEKPHGEKAADNSNPRRR